MAQTQCRVAFARAVSVYLHTHTSPVQVKVTPNLTHPAEGEKEIESDRATQKPRPCCTPPALSSPGHDLPIVLRPSLSMSASSVHFPMRSPLITQ